MLKTTLISTIITAAAFQVAAESTTKYDLSNLPADVAARVAHLQQYGDRFEATIEATLAEWSKPAYTGGETDYDLSILPPDVAARVTELQKHGDRFEPAIRAIFVEALKPCSSFDGGDHETVDINVSMPQS